MGWEWGRDSETGNGRGGWVRRVPEGTERDVQGRGPVNINDKEDGPYDGGVRGPLVDRVGSEEVRKGVSRGELLLKGLVGQILSLGDGGLDG